MRAYWFLIEKACAGIAGANVLLANIPLFVGDVFCALANAARTKKMICERKERE